MRTTTALPSSFYSEERKGGGFLDRRQPKAGLCTARGGQRNRETLQEGARQGLSDVAEL